MKKRIGFLLTLLLFCSCGNDSRQSSSPLETPDSELIRKKNVLPSIEILDCQVYFNSKMASIKVVQSDRSWGLKLQRELTQRPQELNAQAAITKDCTLQLTTLDEQAYSLEIDFGGVQRQEISEALEASLIEISLDQGTAVEQQFQNVQCYLKDSDQLIQKFPELSQCNRLNI